MKTLAEQYKLIQEGKGDIDFFKKSAINQMGGAISHLNSFDDMVGILKNKGVIVEEVNFFQGLDPKKAIEKAKTEVEHANKSNNWAMGEKIGGQLKSYLDSKHYNWKQDPHALDILGDFVNENEVTDVAKDAKISASDLKYIIDVSKNAEEFQTKVNEFLKQRHINHHISPDVLQNLYNRVKKQAIDKLMMKESVKDDAKVIFDADRVNPYELLKGIKVELGIDYEMSTDEEVMAAKKKAVSNLQKDPLYYSNKIAGVKRVDPEKRADTMKYINKKKTNLIDNFNAMKSVSKLPKANVTDRGDKEKATRSQMRSAHKKSLNEMLNNVDDFLILESRYEWTPQISNELKKYCKIKQTDKEGIILYVPEKGTEILGYACQKGTVKNVNVTIIVPQNDDFEKTLKTLGAKEI